MSARRAASAAVLAGTLWLGGVAQAAPVWQITYVAENFRPSPGPDGDYVDFDGCVLRTNVVGGPNLPVQECRFVVPLDFQATSVSVSAATYERLPGTFAIPPRQPNLPLDGNPSPELAKPDAKIYGTDTPFPSNPVRLAGNSTVMGFRVVTLEVCPLRYVPRSGRLQVLTHLEVTLQGRPIAAPGFAALRRSERSQEVVQRTLAGLVRNLESVNEWGPPSNTSASSRDGSRTTPWPTLDGEPVDYVIITSAALAPSFAPLAQWRCAQGWHAVINTVEDIDANYPGVDAAERIRNFLIEAGQLWGTAFVLLGGDVDVVPARFANPPDGPTDLYYATADGNWNADGDALFGESTDEVDEGIDFHVGRAPVNSAAEVSVLVQKVLAYEQNPPTDFVESALLMGASHSLSWDQGQLIKRYIYDNYLPTNYDRWRLYNRLLDGDELLLHDSAMAHLNQGYHFINHYDHSNPRAMGTGTIYSNQSIGANDVATLTNGARRGVLFTLGCSPNAFDYDSISETFMNLPGGGTVAFMGNTRSGYAWQESQDKEFFRQVFVAHETCLGEAFSIARTTHTAGDDHYAFRVLNLLGDPAMTLWTAEPGQLVLGHPSTVPLGDSRVGITVTDAATGLRVPAVRVALYKENELLVSGLTGSTGYVNLGVHCDTEGEVLVSATMQNYRPVQGSMWAMTPDYTYLYVSGYDVDDDVVGESDGNDNGAADVGEVIELPLQITNDGERLVYDLTATLVSLTPGATVQVATHELPDIWPWQTVSTPAFVVALDETLAPETRVHLRVDFDGYVDVELTPGVRKPPDVWGWYRKSDSFYVPVHAPGLEICRLSFYDNGQGGSQGDGDGVIEPDELISYYFELGNSGHGAARGVTATATSLHSNVVIVDPNCSFGAIPPLGAVPAGDPVLMRILNAPQGSEQFRLDVSDFYMLRTSIVVDLVRPSAPSNLAFQSGADYIRLTWTPPAQADVRGYHVYRGVAPLGPFTRVTTLLQVGSALYVDENLGGEVEYYYRVTAVDESGNESEQSASLHAWITEPPQPGWPIQVAGEINGSAALVDVDNDGTKEIFFTTKDGRVYAFYYDGRELFDLDHNPTTISGFATMDATGSAWGDASVADLNNDGVYEVVATSRGSEQKIYAWSIADTNQDGQPDPLPGWPKYIPNNDGKGICAATLADINADTFLEVLFNGERRGTVHALNYLGNELSGWPKVDLGNFSYPAPAVASLDADNYLEVIVGGYTGSIYVWDHTGQPRAGWPFSPGGSGCGAVAVGDIDNDGQPEILGTLGNRLYALEKNGTQVAGWSGGKTFPLQNYVVPGPVLADVTGDGVPEIFLKTKRGLSAWRGNGSVLPGWPKDLGSDTNVLSPPAVADIDGDGQMEIVSAHGDGRVYAFEADGTGVVRWPAIVGYAEVNAGPSIDDLDGDGDLEVVIGAGETMYIFDCQAQVGVHPIEWGTFHFDPQRRGKYVP